MTYTNSTHCQPPFILGPVALQILETVMHGNGMPPTVRDLKRVCGLKSPNAIQGHLVRLRKLGLLAWEPGCARTLMPRCRWIPESELADAV